MVQKNESDLRPIGRYSATLPLTRFPVAENLSIKFDTVSRGCRQLTDRVF
jgi:hypothetical protein